MAEMQLI